MEIPKPKSQSPKIHDNTEEDLILVPPSVLDNKLRDFEEYHKAHSIISGDIALAIVLLVTVLTTTFKDVYFLKGLTIRGVFLTGFIVMLIKIGHNLYKIFYADKHSRTDVVKFLLTQKKQNNNKEKSK